MRQLANSIWGGLEKAREPRQPGLITSSPRFGATRCLWLILCGSFLIAAIVIGTAVMVGEFRERALSNSERELENTVLLLTRHFDQQLEPVEIITNDLISKMQSSPRSSLA